MLRDINAHSLSWNLDCIRQQNAGPLENLINKYKLIVNNNTNFATRSQSQRNFIIDLALTTTSLRPLTLSKIDKKYLLVLNHEFILL